MPLETLSTHKDVQAVERIAAVPKILEVVTRITGMRFAAIARVTESQWVACAVRDDIAFGLAPGSELELCSTICNEVRQHQQPVVFGHASEHPHFSSHHTPLQYGLESYISVPIFRGGGAFFGTLCAIDPRPAELDDPSILGSLELFAELIGLQLDTEDELELSQAALGTALDLATLREQIVAGIGQDLKQPIQGVIMESYLAKTIPGLDPAVRGHLDAIETTVWQMSARLGDLMDVGRRRLSEGVPLAPTSAQVLSHELDLVLSDVAAAHPRRALAAMVVIERPVECDARRLADLLMHLLKHALQHGNADRPVSVAATTTDLTLTLQIVSRGKPAPAHDGASRAVARAPGRVVPMDLTDDVGMDLFIASQIAQAHGGRIDAASSSDATLLTFTMPLVAAPLPG